MCPRFLCSMEGEMDEVIPQILEEAMPQSSVTVVVQPWNVPHRSLCLNIWSPASGSSLQDYPTFWKRSLAWKEVDHWGWICLAPLPVFSPLLNCWWNMMVNLCLCSCMIQTLATKSSKQDKTMAFFFFLRHFVRDIPSQKMKHLYSTQILSVPICATYALCAHFCL